MGIDDSLIRILTVDDHPLLRKGIAALVNVENDMKLVAEASNGEEAIERFRLYRPDVRQLTVCTAISAARIQPRGYVSSAELVSAMWRNLVWNPSCFRKAGRVTSRDQGFHA
jgi:DNA-binding NarL/FixJ family response regulator